MSEYYYDRLRKRNKYFEIPTFLPIERRKFKADKIQNDVTISSEKNIFSSSVPYCI